MGRGHYRAYTFCSYFYTVCIFTCIYFYFNKHFKSIFRIFFLFVFLYLLDHVLALWLQQQNNVNYLFCWVIFFSISFKKNSSWNSCSSWGLHRPSSKPALYLSFEKLPSSHDGKSSHSIKQFLLPQWKWEITPTIFICITNDIPPLTYILSPIFPLVCLRGKLCVLSSCLWKNAYQLEKG